MNFPAFLKLILNTNKLLSWQSQRNCVYDFKASLSDKLKNVSCYNLTNFLTSSSKANCFHIIFWKLIQDFGIFNGNISTFFHIDLTTFRRHTSDLSHLNHFHVILLQAKSRFWHFQHSLTSI